MRKTLIIIGSSQLSFFVAKQLGDSLGELAHLNIVWLTNTRKIFPTAHKPVAIKSKLNNVTVRQASIRSINLRDRRVVTGTKAYDFDLLFVDQSPVFTDKEYENVVDQFETLISTVRAKENRGVLTKAKVLLAGESHDLRQMALTLSLRKLKDSSAAVSAIRVEATPVPGKMIDFFKEVRVFARKSQYPGIVVKPPRTMIATKKIKGLRVDMAGHAILLATGEPENHQNVLVVDGPDRQSQNIARSDWSLAKQISHNLTVKLDGGLEKPLDYLGDKLLLESNGRYFVKLGDMVSSRNRAKAVYYLDRRFWKSRI